MRSGHFGEVKKNGGRYVEACRYFVLENKMMFFDLKPADIGSANLMGAGIGMKSCLRRNFEAGVLTNDPDFVLPSIELLDTLWMGSRCKNCGCQEFCGNRIK